MAEKLLKKVRFKARKGNGELIGLSIVSLMLCTIFIVLVAVIQFECCSDSLINTAGTVARCAATSNGLTEAEQAGELLANNTNHNNNVSGYMVKVENLTSPGKWRTGDELKVTVSARFSNILPHLFNRNYSVSEIVVIENRELKFDYGGAEGQIIRALEARGYSQAGIAAMCACIYHESRYRNNYYEDGEYGILGWTGERQNRLTAAFPDSYADLDGQIAFMISELNDTYTGTDAVLKNAGTDRVQAKEAAMYVMANYVKEGGSPSSYRSTIEAYIEYFYENNKLTGYS